MLDVEFIQFVLLYFCMLMLSFCWPPSVFALQSLVDICASELEFLDMAINVKKIVMFALRLKIQKCVL